MIKYMMAILCIVPLQLCANGYVDLLTQEEPSLWISLFALAIVSMLSLYLSSEQLKELDKKHKMILEKEKEVEKKQQFILEFMSGKIETSTKGIIQRRENLEKNIYEDMSPSFFKQEIEKFQEGEALLLDATHELIDFLKIKSGTLEIKEESYKVSNILNETFSKVHKNFKATSTELIYDISPDVSSHLLGDSKRIEQILSTILDDAMVGVSAGTVVLKLALSATDKNNMIIEVHNKNKVMLPEEINVLFENYRLKEEYKSKDKLYMYIAYQLILQMKGSLAIRSSNDEGTYYHIELPYTPSRDIPETTIPSKTYKDMRILVCTNTIPLSQMLKERLSVYNILVDTFDKNSLDEHIPNMMKYDACIFDNSLLNHSLVSKLKILNASHNTGIFVLKNIYEDSIFLHTKIPFEIIYKPLQNEQIVSILESLRIEKFKPTSTIVIPDVEDISSGEVTLLKDTQGITRENFKQFSHLHILIVEDNRMNQKILKGVFASSGMSISMANNGLEALDEVKRNSELDLIFMDTNMPVMDGYESTKQIRKFRSGKMLPIIAIESIGFTQNTHEIDGINAFLHKPFKIGQLYTALMTYTSHKQSTVKHVMHKLSKYEPNNAVLNIKKGISHANTAIFYKEVLLETGITLNHSANVLESYILKAEHKELKSFILDTIRLSEIIGATGLRKILIEMMQTFDYKQENKLQDYIPIYKKELTLLKNEMSEYLKT